MCHIEYIPTPGTLGTKPTDNIAISATEQKFHGMTEASSLKILHNDDLLIYVKAHAFRRRVKMCGATISFSATSARHS